MNDQYCTKPNVQMYLTWLLVNLFRDVVGGRFVSLVSAKSNGSKKIRASFLPFRSALLHFPTVVYPRETKSFIVRCPSRDIGFTIHVLSTAEHTEPIKRNSKKTSCNPPDYSFPDSIHSRIHPQHQGTIHQQFVIQKLSIARRDG
ncbi:MAG: hypothetical protein ABF629_08045 [Sporolactobacillus sp.]